MTNLTFTENAFTAIIEADGSAFKQRHAREVLAMCTTLDDVQRCAAMGDFKIVRYDLRAA